MPYVPGLSERAAGPGRPGGSVSIPSHAITFFCPKRKRLGGAPLPRRRHPTAYWCSSAYVASGRAGAGCPPAPRKQQGGPAPWPCPLPRALPTGAARGTVLWTGSRRGRWRGRQQGRGDRAVPERGRGVSGMARGWLWVPDPGATSAGPGWWQEGDAPVSQDGTPAVSPRLLGHHSPAHAWFGASVSPRCPVWGGHVPRWGLAGARGDTAVVAAAVSVSGSPGRRRREPRCERSAGRCWQCGGWCYWSGGCGAAGSGPVQPRCPRGGRTRWGRDWC